MDPETANLNLRRRALPGLLALAASLPLRALLFPFRGGRARDGAPVVFASYMVGDFFMALPALKMLARATPVRVLCRADCLAFLEREGIAGIPFENAFRIRPGIASFFVTLRAALRLRGRLGGIALDLDADPRSALWLRVAGARRVISYRRPFGVLFDETFALPPDALHQADRDQAVMEEYLRKFTAGISPKSAERGARSDEAAQKIGVRPVPPPSLSSHHSSLTAHHPAPPWLLSVWTRKPAKNWPLDQWEEFMGILREEGVPFAILHAPDGDGAFRLFRARWAGRAEFVEGSLEAVADRVRASAGVIATDNFLGHMAAYYEKPVLWINIASPAAQVQPRGPRTAGMRADPRKPGSPPVEAVRRAFAELRARVR